MVIFLQCGKDYFRNSLYKLEKAMCKLGKACANWELLQVRQSSVGNIKKRKVIEMTICVQTINGVKMDFLS